MYNEIILFYELDEFGSVSMRSTFSATIQAIANVCRKLSLPSPCMARRRFVHFFVPASRSQTTFCGQQSGRAISSLSIWISHAKKQWNGAAPSRSTWNLDPLPRRCSVKRKSIWMIVVRAKRCWTWSKSSDF